MKQLLTSGIIGEYRYRILFFCISSLVAILASHTSEAGTITGVGPVSGSLFNTASRQHIQANFSGRGIHRPSGQQGRTNGGVSSLPGQRTPRATLFGAYRVNVRANVRYGGGSTSVSKVITLYVRRRSIVIGGGIGKIQLKRAIKPRKTGRQRIRGKGTITVRGV